jgi:hypothetical protein
MQDLQIAQVLRFFAFVVHFYKPNPVFDRCKIDKLTERKELIKGL